MQLKRILPVDVFRALTVIFNAAMKHVPFAWKYGLATRLLRRRAPYRFLQSNDTVVQVGSARDILHTGRSRAIHFSRIVLPYGRVLVVEADAANCAALRELIARQRIENIEVVECGAWSQATQLAFLSSPHHPASNLLMDVREVSEELMRKRKYEIQLIDVDSIDDILARMNAATPALVSLTTNGAELQILRGMQRTIEQGCRFISLASTGHGYHGHMDQLGYEYVARDDRGYCFEKKATASSHSFPSVA